MQGKIILVLVFILLLLSLIFFLLRQPPDLESYKKMRVQIQNKPYTLFVADTEEKKNKGLSGIVSLKDNQGMIFIFEKPDFYYFWMKDMRFPLDFIFLNENKVVDTITDISPKIYPATFTSSKKANKIIEFNAGEIKKLKLERGDFIKLF